MTNLSLSLAMGNYDRTRAIVDGTVKIDGVDPVLQAVIIYGTAELDYEDVITKRIALFEKYMSTEDAVGFASSLAETYEPVIIRVKPQQRITFDYSKGMGI